ncbi:S-layer homology domain-containing protein [Paenibacillus silviterrae]|uniref:S-layer homology domain-containing protein n=1 Tax=Paenibacillus silviterrae TaxID=3242194 RepID=UPI002543D354|nr:S-layer homology domain-containing protein [Paenibacillus chinjuensis]
MKHTCVGYLMAVVLAVLLLPVHVFASDGRSVTAIVSGNQVTIDGENGSYAGRTVTLRLADPYSRTVVADEVQAQAGGSYSFGPYALQDGSYTAFVGGAGTVETKMFNVGAAVPDMSSNANLQTLTVSTGTLDFNGTTLEYTVQVGHSVDAITVTAVPEEAHASVKINAAAASSKQIELSTGNTAIPVDVTAQDGTTTKSYRILIKKAALQTADSSARLQVDPAEPVSIHVPAGVTNAKIASVVSAAGSNKTAVLPLIDVLVVTTLGHIQMTIPEGTQVTGPTGWDGTILLPEALRSGSVSVRGGQASTVVEVGSPDLPLTFDHAVRLLLPNQGGKSAGFVRDGIFTPITRSISADTQVAANREIAAGGDALLTVGSDLVIWTKHFTQFVSYTPNTAPDSSGHRGSGGVLTNMSSISGTAGGTLTLNGVTIVVPAGALDGSIQFTIDKLGETASLPYDESLVKISDVYEMKKDREGEFSKPVTITLPYDKSKAGSDKSKVGIYGLNEQTRSWVRLNDLKVDESASTVTGTVTHFTKYAVFASKEPAAQTVQSPDPAVNLSDIQGHWAEPAVLQLVKMGAITGYPDHTFKPNERITRAEFVTLIVKASGFEAQNGKSFADTQAHWAQPAISTASALGIVDGYSEMAFAPEDWITREQMAAIVIRAAQIDSAEPVSVHFSDSSSISDWAKTPLAAAAAKGLIAGYEDGSVKPRANATRAEAAAVILRALQMKK